MRLVVAKSWTSASTREVAVSLLSLSIFDSRITKINMMVFNTRKGAILRKGLLSGAPTREPGFLWRTFIVCPLPFLTITRHAISKYLAI